MLCGVDGSGVDRVDHEHLRGTYDALAEAVAGLGDVLDRGHLHLRVGTQVAERLVERRVERVARLAEAENEVLALELTQMRVASGSTDGKPNPASSVLKLRGSQLQQLATELLVEVAGPDALPFDAGADLGSPEWAQRSAPTYLNYRKTSIYGGSNEVQRTIIASTILGL